MEKGSSSRTIKTQQQESLELAKKDDDEVVLPTELMHHILSFLSEEEAARTWVLSKSWHHAWSTLPNLRFPDDHPVTTNLIYTIIQRRGNIPIEALKFCIKVKNLKLDEIQMERILAPETTSCLKKLSCTISSDNFSKDSTFTFSDDLLFSGEKLEKIKLKATGGLSSINLGINPVINCVSLRVLELTQVNISKDVFKYLLSTCSLLEKVILFLCLGLKRIKVENLRCLRRLEITPSPVEEDGLILEIVNVPNLGFFYYKSWNDRLPFKTTDATASSLGRSVTRLHLEGTHIDDTFFNMIKSKFPFLESLDLEIGKRAPGSFVIASRSLKRLALRSVSHIVLYVYAPNLLSCDCDCTSVPDLTFPIIAPKEIKLSFKKSYTTLLYKYFFPDLRELLDKLSASKFDIHITILSSGRGLSVPPNNDDDFNFDKLRRQGSNVQQLSITAGSNDCPWKGTRIFINALFSICHPVYFKVSKRFISQLTEVLMEYSGRLEAGDFLDSLPETDDLVYKFNWFSHD